MDTCERLNALARAVANLCDMEGCISGSTVSTTTSYWMGFIRAAELLLEHSDLSDIPQDMYDNAAANLDYDFRLLSREYEQSGEQAK